LQELLDSDENYTQQGHKRAFQGGKLQVTGYKPLW
jgi:hypothetical protein